MTGSESSEEFRGLLAENVSHLRFVAWDTETTGARPGVDHIVEIAALAFDEEFTHRRYDSLVRPPIPIPLQVQAIHGISDAMVVQAPRAGEVMTQFSEFLQWTGRPRILLAHNCGFDVGMVHGECGRLEKGFEVASGASNGAEIVIDTCMMAKTLLPDLPHHRLSDLGQHFKVNPPEKYHRAMADVEVLHQVFLNLLGLAADQWARRDGGLTFESLVDIAGGFFLMDFNDRAIQKKPFRLSPKLQILESLVGTGTAVSIVYNTDNDVRYINPLGIKIKGFRVYVEALCLRENIKKTFRADRILKVSM